MWSPPFAPCGIGRGGLGVNKVPFGWAMNKLPTPSPLRGVSWGTAGEGLPEEQLRQTQAYWGPTWVDSPSSKKVKPKCSLRGGGAGGPSRARRACSLGLSQSVMGYSPLEGSGDPASACRYRWDRHGAPAGWAVLAEEKGQGSAGLLRGGVCRRMLWWLFQGLGEEQEREVLWGVLAGMQGADRPSGEP